MIIRKPWLRHAFTFDLGRHEGDPNPPADPATDPPADPPADDPTDDPDDDGADQLGDAGKQAIARMKAERNASKREAAAAKKDLAAAQKRLQERDDAEKTEAQKLADRVTAAEQRAQQATERAVLAEVRASAADAFADPSDAAEVLARDPAKFIGDDGSIDSDAIQSALDELLERKPHWRKAKADPTPSKPKPKPDPSQGGGRGEAPPTDFRTATKEERDAELAKSGYRMRS